MTYEQLILQASQTRVAYIVDIMNAVDAEVMSQLTPGETYARVQIEIKILRVVSVFTLTDEERFAMQAELLARITEKHQRTIQ